jgi:hypothetical protein
MPEEPVVIRILRKEDLLDLTIELTNIDVVNDTPTLARHTPGLPALLIVHLPPQHIAEEAFPDGQALAAVPVRAVAGGPTRLVFSLPDNADQWPLNLQTLMGWDAFMPVLAPNALPPGAVTGPRPAPPTAYQTAIEIPAGLILSTDPAGRWEHETEVVILDGRAELWHTRLRTTPMAPDEPHPAAEVTDGCLRAVWTTDPQIPFRWSMGTSADPSRSYVDRESEINRLTSDFGLPVPPGWVLVQPWRRQQWWQQLDSAGFPRHYVPIPLRARRLMLTSLGAWADIESSWDYPSVTPGKDDDLGYPQFGVAQYTHITSQGRDQYVRIVEKCVAWPTGHRVSRVTVTQREFQPNLVRVEQHDGHDVSIFGADARLRQYEQFIIQEPLKDFAGLAGVSEYQGREMPLSSIRILTDATPSAEPAPGVVGAEEWPTVGGKDFLFHCLALDLEGHAVTFSLPLMLVRLRDIITADDWEKYNRIYNAANLARRTVTLNNQQVTYAASTPGKRGSTTLTTQQLVFEAARIPDAKLANVPPAQPPFLPKVVSATVSIPAVERLLGPGKSTAAITFDPDYLSHGLDHAVNKGEDPTVNKGEVFAMLAPPLALPFAAEKAGGLIKPDSTVSGLSRSVGTVADVATAKTGQLDTSKFRDARFLGGISLADILDATATFDPATIAAVDVPADQLAALLQDPHFRLQVPMLTTRTIYPPGLDPNDRASRPTAAETRFVWKPQIKRFSPPGGIFSFETTRDVTNFDHDAQLVVQAHLLTPLGGNADATYDMDGQLRDFALNFAGAMMLKFTSLSFHARNGKKMEVSAEGLDLRFAGPLEFVNTLKDIIPADGFSDPPSLEVTAAGVRASYSLGVPTVGVGVFSLQNLNLSAGLTLPFIDQPAGVRFGLSERHSPFLVTVAIFGGGGFFALALNAHGIEQIEAAIEFGGNISLNLGVASGGVYVMAGIYFSMTGDEVKLTGYLRCGGFLSVLGLISISLEFYLAFTYRQKDHGGGEAWGQASLTVCVSIAFFSKSVTLSVERRFAGAAGDPTFADMVEPADWDQYCAAFA